VSGSRFGPEGLFTAIVRRAKFGEGGGERHGNLSADKIGFGKGYRGRGGDKIASGGGGLIGRRAHQFSLWALFPTFPFVYHGPRWASSLTYCSSKKNRARVGIG